ncbi:MAG: bifunctional metallophosphatase/5'-nucleotidase [Desulfobacteraceae bacterium]|nr:bifunctional metallophosphatase/5'-nucleotidase [Desulfobacteraceae bacterium]
MNRTYTYKLVIAWVLTILVLTAGCAGIIQKRPDSASIVIAETSDVHGALFPWDFIENKKADTSLAQIQTWINEQKDAGITPLLLDNGDILQGQPTVYYSNFEAVKDEHLVASVMNYMDYGAGSVGNHDIEPGHPVFDKIVREFEFPWLAANAIDKSTGKPYFKPYTVIKQKGIKIAVLGLITPGIPNWLPENIWEGIEFEDMVVSAERWVPIIREKENPDLLVGLFHSGVDFTYGGGDENTPNNENATKLVALKVPGFDVVFAGHDHAGWNEILDNGVLLLGARNAARTLAVARIDLQWDKEALKWVKRKQGQIIDVAGLSPDPDYMAAFEPKIDMIKSYVSKKVGTLASAISTREAMFGDSAFVDLIHRIQLDITDADISFAAPLSFDKTIDAGDMFVRDMFKLYKYENLLYTMKLSGREVKDFLEYSYGLWFNQMQNAEDHLMNFKKDDKGDLIFSPRNNSYETTARYYNYDSAAGINYTVDVSKPMGERIAISSMADGKPFDMTSEYTIAINSYRGNGGGGHLTRGAGIPKDKLTDRMISSTIKDLRYFLMKWIEEKGVVTPAAFGNWQVIPGEWWEKAKQKDHEMLFGKK